MSAPTPRPLVSVVLPVYNHARYVADAIRSVLDQDWRPLEIIIIDDGSSDGSLEVINSTVAEIPSCADLKVHVWGRANKGAYLTINEGLARARGEYLAVLNSDDLYLPQRLTRCVRAAQDHQARMVFTYVDPVDDHGSPLPAEHRWRSWYAEVMMQELDLAPSLSSLLLRYNMGISTGNFVFHKSLLDEIGEFADYRYAHDLDFLLRASEVEEPVLIREKLYRYRIHSANTIAESNELITSEVADIVGRYFARTFIKEPSNPLAPRFNKDCYSLASTPWPQHLEMAVDRLMFTPQVTATNGYERSGDQGLVKAPSESRAGRHITLLSHELSRTGAPVLLRDVASSLHSMGVRTHVISMGSGPLAEDYQNMNSPVVVETRPSRLLAQSSGFLAQVAADHRVPDIAKRPLRLGAKLAGGTAARLRMFHYKSKTSGYGPILVNSFASWPIAVPLLERWRGSAFWYIHETYEPGLIMRSARYQERLRSLVEQDRVTFLFGSEATRAKWASEGFDGEVFYWSGLSSVGQAPIEASHEGRPTILSIQSTGPRKGTRTLIEAFAHGRRIGIIEQDVELRIVGAHPPSRNALSRDLLCRIMEPDLRGSVQLIPNLSPLELEAYYRDAAVYVQSSTMECLPLALLNAMAYGLPIVSTDADGCREAIINGQTGLLIPPRQPKLMANALARLLEDRLAASEFGKAARDLFAEMFSLEATAPKLMNRLTA